MQLHRAIASIRHSDEPEVVVFFEAHPGEISPSSRLLMLLSSLWRVPIAEVEAYNVTSERHLLRECISPEEHGDARLFETGCDGGVIAYARHDRPLFLVRPSTLKRLRAAQAQSHSCAAAAIRRSIPGRTSALEVQA